MCILCIRAIHEAIFEMYVCKVMFRHGNVSELHNIRWKKNLLACWKRPARIAR